MRKSEPVDEYAETEVLVAAVDPRDRENDTLSLFVEYESELAQDGAKRRDARTRR